MGRPVYLTAIILFAVGGGVFLYKVFALDMAVRPDRNARVWQVEMAVSLRGEDRNGAIELRIPRSDDRQVLLEEQSFDDGLTFSSRQSENDRQAVWRGVIGETQRVAYTFRVHLPRPGKRMPRASETAASTAQSDGQIRNGALDLERTLERLGVSKRDDAEAIIATTFGFVAHEIETAAMGSDDPRLVLRAREGSLMGQARLLTELLVTAGVDARVAQGIHLPTNGPTVVTPFAEARGAAGWVPLFTDLDAPGEQPPRFLVLLHGDRPILATTGIQASHLEFNVLRESVPATELASFVSPDSAFWRALSLYRLPLDIQQTLRILLLFPLAALIAAIFRNLVGIRTFGTFMPILIALSLRSTELAAGLLLISSVTLGGVLGRLLFDRLKLLFVPRICLLLCLVILVVTGLAQIGYQVDGRGLMSGLLFPIVILAMLIERISVTTLEEGVESSTKLAAGSIALAALAYPVFQSDWLAHLFFGFPELILCVMALLVLIGGYTGYRLSELWRFRAFASSQGGSV